MVFPYMDHDLSGLLNNPKVRLSVPQIKLYMKQLLEGTIYMHAVRRVCVVPFFPQVVDNEPLDNGSLTMSFC